MKKEKVKIDVEFAKDLLNNMQEDDVNYNKLKDLIFKNEDAYPKTLTVRDVAWLIQLGNILKFPEKYENVKCSQDEDDKCYVNYKEVAKYLQLKFGFVVSDYAKLEKFGLIEKMKEKYESSEDKQKHKQSGYWRLTQNGKLFLIGHLMINETLYIRSNKVIRKSDNLITVNNVKDCNFQELINNFKSF